MKKNPWHQKKMYCVIKYVSWYGWLCLNLLSNHQHISSIFLLVVRVEIDSITAKPYIPQKSWFQWICSKFFGLWHGHNYFRPPWLSRLLEAKNDIASAHFGTQLNVWFIPQCLFCLPKEIKSNPNQMFTNKWDQL